MSETLVKGNCPKCNAKLGFYVSAYRIGVVIMDIDESWHRINCPRCGAELECRARPREGQHEATHC